MSRTRDGLNLGAMVRMLAGPPREADQPLRVAAAGAGGGGGGGGGLAAWAKEITLAGTALTVGRAYYWTGSAWAALTPSIATRATIAVCTAAVTESPAASTLLVAGEFSRSGTVGPLFAAASGVITSTYQGDEDDVTTTAPWVWPLAWQVDAGTAIVLPCDPYRPRRLTYCLADGETQLVVTVREFPADP
jgi:hypothetical protein